MSKTKKICYLAVLTALSAAYESIPDGVDFSTEFPTFILAFCPDTDR